MKIRTRFLKLSALAAFAALAGNLAVSGAPLKALDISLTPIGTHTNGPPYALSDAEIVAHDPGTQRLYVGNARDIRIDVLDITDPTNPTKIEHVDMSPYGLVVNSVAVKNGLIAVAVEAAKKTDPGVVVFLNR